MINRRALFSDETADFKIPYAPQKGDDVTVVIRTMMGDVWTAKVVIDGTPFEMEKSSTDGTFDYYSYTFVCPDKKVRYYFEVVDEDDRVFFNRKGAVENNQDEYDFSFIPGFKVPDWALGTIYYQIFTDRFRNGSTINDVRDNEYYYTGGHVKNIRDWNGSSRGLQSL